MRVFLHMLKNGESTRWDTIGLVYKILELIILSVYLILDAYNCMEQSSAGSSGGKSKEEVVLELAIDFSSRLPEAFDLDLARYKYPVMYYESMNSVLHQEMIRFNRLTDVKITSLITHILFYLLALSVGQRLWIDSSVSRAKFQTTLRLHLDVTCSCYYFGLVYLMWLLTIYLDIYVASDIYPVNYNYFGYF